MAVDLRLMRYVVTIADEGGFQRAADRLHMAQPPLSKQVRDLERELGVRLFERRPTRLTEAGKVFVESARQLLAEAERLAERTVQAGQGRLGTVWIGHTVTAAYDTLPKLLAGMAEHHPGIQLETREDWPPELLTGLAAQRYDVVLGSGLRMGMGFARKLLRRERLVALVGVGNPMAVHADQEVRLRDFRGHPFHFFPRRFSPMYYDTVVAALHESGERFEVWENPVPGMRHWKLREGVGFSVVPESVADRRPDQTVQMRLADDLPRIEVELIWNRQSPSAATSVLLDTASVLSEKFGWITP